jgi:Uma2 family endonuclease
MQPDLLVACDLETAVNEKGRYMGTPALCIEILSKSTRTRGHGRQAEHIHALRGQGVLDRRSRKSSSVLAYGLKDCSIGECTAYKPGDTLLSYNFVGLAIPVNEIFQS